MRPGRVLIVDDDRDLAESLGEFLELDGHAVDLAFGGRAGVEAALDGDHDLIVIDVGLPDVDGVACARAILQARSSARIILVTGHAAADVPGLDEANLEVDMLVKPVPPDRIAERVRGARDARG